MAVHIFFIYIYTYLYYPSSMWSYNPRQCHRQGPKHEINVVFNRGHFFIPALYPASELYVMAIHTFVCVVETLFKWLEDIEPFAMRQKLIHECSISGFIRLTSERSNGPQSAPQDIPKVTSTQHSHLTIF